MLYKKKKKQNYFGDLDPHVHQGITLDPMGGLQLPPDPQLQSFLALPRTIFSVLSPVLGNLGSNC